MRGWVCLRDRIQVSPNEGVCLRQKITESSNEGVCLTSKITGIAKREGVEI